MGKYIREGVAPDFFYGPVHVSSCTPGNVFVIKDDALHRRLSSRDRLIFYLYLVLDDKRELPCVARGNWAWGCSKLSRNQMRGDRTRCPHG